jgi:hypothetical protein
MRLEAENRSLRKLINAVGAEHVQDVVMCGYCDRNANFASIRFGDGYHYFNDEVREYWTAFWNKETCFKVTDLELDGDDVLTLLNIPPGPKVGEVLKFLFDCVVFEVVENDTNELLELMMDAYGTDYEGAECVLDYCCECGTKLKEHNCPKGCDEGLPK